jgi:biotin carboxylase
VKRVLLLMASRTYKARAFLSAARRLDCATVVGSDRMQVLSRLDPAGNLLLPFHDVSQSVRRILGHDAKYPLDAVLATDDEGAVIAAAASAALGLPSNPVHAVRDATHKGQTRRVLCAAGLPTATFREVADQAEALVAAQSIGYPCVLKPLEMSASRGVIRVDNDHELRAACMRLQAILQDASETASPTTNGRSPGWLVEAYIPGREFALEGVLQGGKLHLLALFDKPDPLEGPFFQETYYITPSRLPAEQQQAMENMVGNAARALGLREGPVHAEVRDNGHNLFVLEVAPRSIGGRCSTALRLGRDGNTALEEVLLAVALGSMTQIPPRQVDASGVLMIPIANAGILREVRGIESARAVAGVTALEITIPVGQTIQPPPEGWQYLGFLFARGRQPQDVEKALREAHAQLQVVIEPMRPPLEMTHGNPKPS